MRVRRTVRRASVPGSSPGSALLPWMAGAAVGLVAGWWLGRTSGAGDPAAPDLDDGWADRWGERVDAAMEAAADGFRGLERRWRETRPLDPALLTRALEGVAGGRGIRARPVGAGLVELVGDAPDGAAREARLAVGAVPGVRAVVSRIWTPSSADPEQIDAPSGFG